MAELHGVCFHWNGTRHFERLATPHAGTPQAAGGSQGRFPGSCPESRAFFDQLRDYRWIGEG